jgi:DNA-binding MarR family transcriptional regulator
MMALWEYGEMTVSKMGERLYLDSGTLTPLLKKMEARGLLVRVRSQEDGRRVDVSLTDEGRALRTQALEVPRCIAGRIAFDPAEGLQLKQLLDKLLAVLSE